MTLDATQVRVAVSGAVYVGPVGTAAPVSSHDTVNAAFVDLGYVGEDGVTITPNDTTQGINAWQNAARVRTVYTEQFWTFKFKLIETKGKTVGLYFRNSTGPSVVSAGEWYILPDQTNPDQRAFIIDVVDGTKYYRYYIPNGEVTERSEITNVNGDAIGYDVTITANYSSTISAPFKAFSSDTAWGYS